MCESVRIPLGIEGDNVNEGRGDESGKKRKGLTEEGGERKGWRDVYGGGAIRSNCGVGGAVNPG
jgi:hypothetical protein